MVESIFDKLTSKPQTPPKPQFSLEEAEVPDKEVYTIYGEKGVGKTSFSLGFPGTIAVLSFDRKSALAKSNFHNGDQRITVYDAVKYYGRDTDKVLDSAEISYEFIQFLLKEISKSKPDWIVIDGVEILQKIAEFVMRKHNNLGPYQGVANPNVWKERNSIIDEIHRESIDACKRGVIYTTYTDTKEIIQEGTLITKEKVPKWIDSVMWETDVVLFINSYWDAQSKRQRVTLRCDSSKFDKRIKTGTMVDITGKKAQEVINFAD